MASQYARGKQLIEEKKLDEAIVALTSALKESPTSPVYLTTRALAYQRNKQYPEALADADAAVVVEHPAPAPAASVQTRDVRPSSGTVVAG